MRFFQYEEASVFCKPTQSNCAISSGEMVKGKSLLDVKGYRLGDFLRDRTRVGFPGPTPKSTVYIGRINNKCECTK